MGLNMTMMACFARRGHLRVVTISLIFLLAMFADARPSVNVGLQASFSAAPYIVELLYDQTFLPIHASYLHSF